MAYNERQKQTHKELVDRGDLDALATLGIPLTIDKDGVAWIDFNGSEICFHCGFGWLPHVRMDAISEEYLSLNDAIGLAERYNGVEGKVPRSNCQRLADSLERHGWPRGFFPTTH
jgi:hypothetical protein